MKNEHPFAWARKIDSALLQLDTIPLFGKAPPLDIDQISELIRKKLEIHSMSIEKGESSWCTAEEVHEAFASNVINVGIDVSPLSGDLFWSMGREDVAHMTAWLMNGKSRSQASNSEIVQEGFYRFIAVRALEALQELEPFNQFTLKINDQEHSFEKNAYCIDIKISFGKRSCWGCLVLSSQFLNSWQRHFSSMKKPFSLSSMASSLEIPLTICVGNVVLDPAEWQEIHPGDCLILQRSGMQRREKRIANLMLGDVILFYASIHENQIELLDRASVYEENMEHPEHSTFESESNEEGKTVSVKELPLAVTVELARLRMTVDQLMKLSPGNFLELPIHPEQEVSLTVNGKKIGRGELVHLGEVLGVRIIETA